MIYRSLLRVIGLWLVKACFILRRKLIFILIRGLSFKLKNKKFILDLSLLMVTFFQI